MSHGKFSGLIGKKLIFSQLIPLTYASHVERNSLRFVVMDVFNGTGPACNYSYLSQTTTCSVLLQRFVLLVKSQYHILIMHGFPW